LNRRRSNTAAPKQRRHEAVHRREKVFAVAEIGRNPEGAGGIAKTDHQHAPAVFLDQIEGPRRPAGRSPFVARRRARTDGAAGRPEQRVQRLRNRTGSTDETCGRENRPRRTRRDTAGGIHYGTVTSGTSIKFPESS
jgi:hypothetical protein